MPSRSAKLGWRASASWSCASSAWRGVDGVDGVFGWFSSACVCAVGTWIRRCSVYGAAAAGAVGRAGVTPVFWGAKGGCSDEPGVSMLVREWKLWYHAGVTMPGPWEGRRSRLDIVIVSGQSLAEANFPIVTESSIR